MQFDIISLAWLPPRMRRVFFFLVILAFRLVGAELENLPIEELRDRVAKNDSFAKIEMAHRQLVGSVMPFDQGFVLKTFAEGSAAGIAGAHTGLADCHMRGVGMKRETGQVIKLLEMAAKQGDPRGTFRLGWYCCNGILVNRDTARGIELIRQASELGLLDADAGLARLALTGIGLPKDQPTALAQLQTLADEKGNTHAAMTLGDFYRGKIVERVKKDLVLAKKYFSMAAEKNHSGALAAMGDLVLGEKGWDANKATKLEGAKWYRLAIARNSGEGMCNLGNMLMRDTSIRQPGEDWYQLLLDADAVGYGPATLRLAQVNYHAPGYYFRDLDWKKSAEFYERWITENPRERQDIFSAVEKLLEMYFEGGLGLERDFSKCVQIAQRHFDQNTWAAAYAGRVLLHPEAPMGNSREHFIRGYACLLKSRELWKVRGHRMYWLSDEALFVLRSRHGLTRAEVARAEELFEQGFPNNHTPLLP